MKNICFRNDRKYLPEIMAICKVYDCGYNAFMDEVMPQVIDAIKRNATETDLKRIEVWEKEFAKLYE